jgi:hypothetical protein
MKNRVGRILALLLLGVLTLGSTVQAQRTERTIKANIPFDFVVGGEIFPPGHYSVVLIEPVLLELRDSENRTLANVLTYSVQTSAHQDRPGLRFDSEGGQHVLTQVWQEGDPQGRQILRPKSAGLAVRKRSGRVQTAEAGDPRQ